MSDLHYYYLLLLLLHLLIFTPIFNRYFDNSKVFEQLLAVQVTFSLYYVTCNITAALNSYNLLFTPKRICFLLQYFTVQKVGP